MNQTDCQQLRRQIRALLEEPDDAQFCQWVIQMARRAESLLHPPQDIPISDRDILKSFSRFTSDQKVVDWSTSHGITLGHKEFWWAINQDEKEAHINGLGPDDGAGIVGIPRITNGIDVWIERADGKLFKGHREHLVWHRKPRSAGNPKDCTTAEKNNQKSLATAEHKALASKLLSENTITNFSGRYRLICEKDLVFADEVELAECVAEYMEKFLMQTI